MNGILIGAAPYLGLLSTSSVNIPGGRAGPAAREAVKRVKRGRVFREWRDERAA